MPRLARSSHRRTPSAVDLHIKLSRLTSDHDQLKLSFGGLNSLIRAGLLEVEDVFASLAIPLMQLVGLKTVQMATEGRFSSIVISENDHSRKYVINQNAPEEALTRLEIEAANENLRARELEEENLMARAKKASTELREKQRQNLMSIMHLLKQIEAQVNASHDDIFQSLADHRASIQKYFQKAVSYVSAIHQECDTNGMSFITSRLLKSTYEHVGSALGSVEIGVDELISRLAEKMCTPMVKYVNDLRYEMTNGAYPSLLASVEEMGGAIRLQRLEVEEAKRKAREAEKIRLDMLSNLKGTEERMKNMMEAYGLCPETNDGSIQQNVTVKSMKVLEVEEDQAKDEKLLWELLRKRRKLLTPDSPFGPTGLLGVGTTNRSLKAAKKQPSITCNPTPRRQSARLKSQTPSTFCSLPLGSSPSAATQRLMPRIVARK